MTRKTIGGAVANDIADLLIDRVTFHKYKCPHLDECRKTFEEPNDLFQHITTHVSNHSFSSYYNESKKYVVLYFSLISNNLFSYLINTSINLAENDDV